MPLKKGNTNIGAIYKGTTQIAKIYKGTTLLFENAKWLDYLFNYLYHSLIPTTIDNKAAQDKAKLTKISGNGVVENQLLDISTATTTTNGVTFTNNGDGSYTISGTATALIQFHPLSSALTVYANHKYLLMGLNWATGSSSTYDFRVGGNTFYENGIVTQATTVFSQVYFVIRSGVTLNSVRVRPQYIDLTLMFGTGNEPTTLTDNRIQALLNRGYIAYNTGSYKNSKVGEIETFNTNNQLLDTITLPGLLDLNGAINSHDTFEITNTGYVFTRNVGIRAYQSGDESLANVLTDLTNTYYPLATPQVITIPKKHLGCVDLGTLNWQKDSYTYGGQSVYRFKAQVSGIKVTTSTSTIHNLYCKKYMTDTANHSFQQTFQFCHNQYLR